MIKGRENRPHIGIFGRRNHGKSSMINALTGQYTAIVSDIPGTTTDPVRKSVEIHGLGPLIIIDTAGFDDAGEIGILRLDKTRSITQQVDLAILVIADNIFDTIEKELIDIFTSLEVPYILVYNKHDISTPTPGFIKKVREYTQAPLVHFSTKKTAEYEPVLIATIKEQLRSNQPVKSSMLGDLLQHGDIVLLITPIDIEAPEGRMILPQVQAIREILDNDCTAIVVKENEVDTFLRRTGIKPKLAITDSQAFQKADASIPADIPLTSFSILLARQKGDFQAYLKGTPFIDKLKDNDRVLLLESCTHNVSCDDIGRVKIPRWILGYTGKKLFFDTVAGLDKLPRPLEEYALVIQCGGCMITHRQLLNRIRDAKNKNIPITNYGMAIAYVHGIFERAVAPFVKKNSNDS